MRSVKCSEALFVVVPAFRARYAGFGLLLPGSANAIVVLSNGLLRYPPVPVALALGVGLAAVAWSRRNERRFRSPVLWLPIALTGLILVVMLYPEVKMRLALGL